MRGTRFGATAVWVAGIGMGGFVDGIVLHQLLRWHHMVSNRVATDSVDDLRTNIISDGAFHAATWIIAGLAIVLVWQAGRRGELPGLVPFVGLLLLGWGTFNLVDSLLDHYLLQLHHIREDHDEAFWDAAFLVLSLVQVAGGWWIAFGPRLRPELRAAA